MGKSFNAGDAFGTIEAVKTVTDLFSPISGKIVAINEGLDNDPGKVNSDPYGDGWLVIISLSDPDEKDGLMSSIAYEKIIG